MHQSEISKRFGSEKECRWYCLMGLCWLCVWKSGRREEESIHIECHIGVYRLEITYEARMSYVGYILNARMTASKKFTTSSCSW